MLGSGASWYSMPNALPSVSHDHNHVAPASADMMTPKLVTTRICAGRSTGVRMLCASGNAPFACASAGTATAIAAASARTAARRLRRR